MKPVLQALVLAEHVYEDKSGKKIIAGTFHQVMFGVPAVLEVEGSDGGKRQQLVGSVHAGSPYVYLSLTDVCDGTKIRLQFVNLSKNTVLLETAMSLNCQNRLVTIELVLPLPPLPITEAGTYSLEVLSEDTILGSHRVIAIPFPTQQG